MFLRAMTSHLHRIFGGEGNLAHRSARRRRQAFRQHIRQFHILFIQPRHHEVNQLVGFRTKNRLFLRDQALFHHLDGDPHGRQSSAFPVSRLQHIQIAVLDCELKVLHVLVMLFQTRGDFAELFEYIGHDLFEFEDRNRSAHARNHILALRVQ